MPAINDVFSLSFRSTVGTQLVANTLHVRQNPTAGNVDAAHLTALLADANTTSLITAYRAMLTTGDTLDVLVARLVHDPLFPDEPRAEAARTVGLAGTRAPGDTREPTGLCGLITLGSDLAGRRYRGRIFLPPVIDSLQIANGGTIGASSAYRTNINAFITELNKTMYPSGAGHYGGSWNDNDLCIYSLRARTLDVGPFYARVTSAVAKPPLHYLRSREPSV